MKLRTLALRIGLFVSAGIFVIPMYLLFAISMKTSAQVAKSPFAPPLEAHFGNYKDAWNSSAGSGAASFGQAVLNSFLITTFSVVIVIVVGALSGYVLGRRTSRLATWTFAAFLAGIAIPAQMIVLPLYWALTRIEMTGTISGMVLLYVGILLPFTVFLYASFVRALPRDFEEASRIDGASELRTFFRVVFPLLRPVTVTVAILSSVGVWNDFFGQLVFLNASGKETLPVTVYSWATQYATNYPLVTAGLVIALLPMLLFYLVLQRGIIAGFSTGLRG